MELTKITYYNNGLQTFERTSTIEGNARIDLFFKLKDMPYILKTLQLSSSDSSSLETCSYETSDIAAKPTLVQIPEDTSLTGVLKSLKGYTITVLTTASITGTVLGIEYLSLQNSSVQFPHINLLVKNSILKTINISDIQDITIMDENIQKEIRHALEVYLSAKKNDMKRLSIFSNGKEKRTIIARYSIHAQEWRTSYRLILKRDSNDAELHAYAIVENAQDEDWESVELTLVAGAPAIPKKATTSESTTEYGSIKLQIKSLTGSTFSIRVNPYDTVEEIKKKINAHDGTPITSQRLIFAGKQMESGRTASDYNLQSDSVINVVLRAGVTGSADDSSTGTRATFLTGDLSSLSFYKLNAPVTINRSQSSLIPILKSNLKLQHVYLFNKEICPGNPLCSVLFENTTGLTLEGGSIVFTLGDNYLGEAQIETLKPKGETLLPYAIALSTEVNVDQNVSKLPVKRTVVKNGEITFYNVRKQRTIYTYNHLSKAKANLFMDHKFLEGWELVETSEPIDINDRYYRFNFNLPEKEKEREVKIVFNVTEKTTDAETKQILTSPIEDINHWLEKEVISKECHAAIIKIKQLQQESSTISKTIYSQEEEVREALKNQDRVRQNVNVVLASDKASFLKDLRDFEELLKSLYADIKLNKEKRTKIDKLIQDENVRLNFTWLRPGEKSDDPIPTEPNTSSKLVTLSQNIVQQILEDVDATTEVMTKHK